MTPDPTTRVSRGRLVALTVAVVLVAAMLRSPIVAVAPVARSIETDLGVTPSTIGLLTSIPVLAFAVCSPLAIAIIRISGVNLALSISMAGAIAGCLVRSAGGLTAALVGTGMIGLFLTIGNVVAPIVIARQVPPERVHLMTAVYASSFNVGTMTVMLATAPLAGDIGWQGAIAAWAGFGLAALAVWIGLQGVRGAFLPRPSSEHVDDGAPPPRVVRSASTWLLGTAFAGQAFAFYGVTAWLPTLLTDQGFGQTAAGAISAIFQVAGIAGALLTPLVTSRIPIRAGFLAAGVGWLAIPVGFLVDPHLWWVWCVIGGVAQGIGMTLVFILIGALGGGERTVGARSGIVQSVGYGLAATGPIVVGGAHEATGAWTLPLVVILVAVVLLGLAGALAARGAPARHAHPPRVPPTH